MIAKREIRLCSAATLSSAGQGAFVIRSMLGLDDLERAESALPDSAMRKGSVVTEIVISWCIRSSVA